MTLHVAPVGYDAARYAVEHWHYSASLPMPPIIRYGVWEDGRYIGAVLYGRGANKDLGTRFGLDKIEVAELARVALDKHVAPVSEIVARTLRLLRASNPGLRLVISFADPNHGHAGTIYQALGFVYTGQSVPGRQFRDGAGRLWHNRQVSATGYAVEFGNRHRVPSLDQLRLVRLLGKHRYLYPLDRAMRRQIAKLARPYPQTEKSGIHNRSPEPSRN